MNVFLSRNDAAPSSVPFLDRLIFLPRCVYRAHQVRKEVSAVEWFPLDALPKSSFGVEPFMFRLKRWMAKASGKRVPKEASAGDSTREKEERKYCALMKKDPVC